MASVLTKDKTARYLRGILHDRGMSGRTVAESFREPHTTINYQIRQAETMPISVLRKYIQLTGMTDEEIVKVVRG